MSASSDTAFSSRRAVMLSRCARMSPTWRNLLRTSARILVRALDSGSAPVRDLVVSLDFHHAVAARVLRTDFSMPQPVCASVPWRR
jgi:hypothetical protein